MSRFNQSKLLRPKKKGVVHVPPFVFADIESYSGLCKETGQFCLARATTQKGDQQINKRFDTLESFVDYILHPKTPKLIFFWWLKYDAKYIHGELSRRGYIDATVSYTTTTRKNGKKKVIEHNGVRTVEPIINHGRWLGIRIRRPDNPKSVVELRDATNWIPMKLEVAIEKYNIPFKKIPINWKKVIPSNTQIIEKLDRHCLNDCLAGYELMRQWMQTMADRNVRAKLTVGATAIEYLKVHGLEYPVARTSPHYESFIRRAYYGGRVECFKHLHDCTVKRKKGEKGLKVNVFDVNSLYPFVYKQDVPTGLPYFTFALKIKDIPKLQKQGFIECTVDVPYSKYPPLPFRYNKKLQNPCGVLSGVWSVEELQNAIQNFGVEVLAIREALLWMRSEPLLKVFSNLTEEMKLNAITEGERQTIKLIRNSLYGKFGEKAERDEVHFEPLPFELHNSPDVTVHEAEDQGIPYWSRKVISRRSHHLPQIAAYITAKARVFMSNVFQYLDSLGIDILYTDTDSVIVVGDIPDWMIGKIDGLFKLELSGDLYIGLAPKVYALHDSVTDQRRVKIKGFPPSGLTEEHFKRALTGDLTAVTTSWLQAVYRSENISQQLIEQTRSLQNLDSKRNHISLTESKPHYMVGVSE